MTIPEETVRQVRESSDIVEIVSEYVSLKRKGGANYFGNCPFHQEKTPSFSVHPERQIFHCFGCGKGGNVFTFVMEIERIDFVDVVRRLAERAGIKITESGKKVTGQNEELYQVNELAFKMFRHQLTEMEGAEVRFAQEYLRKRDINEEIEEQFEIGLSPPGWNGFITVAQNRGFKPDKIERAGLAIRGEKGWYDRFRGRLMFPIRNAGGRVVAFGGRILREDPDHPSPKYINSPETAIYHKGKMLYGLPQARDAMRGSNETILVEGYTDLIALHAAGFPNSAATLGTALTSDQAALVKRFSEVVTVLYDSDEAGVKAAFRGADVLAGAGLDVKVALLPEGEDPDTLARSGGKKSIEKVLSEAEHLIDFKIGYFKRNGSLDTPRGQSEATRALIDTLRRVPDPITRQFFLHEAAEKLGIDERILGREFNRIKKPTRRRGGQQAKEETQHLSGFDRMLQDLIWVLIRHPEYRADAFEEIKSSQLSNSPLAPVFKLIEAAWLDKKDIKEADLFDALNDKPEVIPLLNEILTRPETDDPDFPSDVVEKAPLLMRAEKIQSKLDNIRKSMKQGSSPQMMQEFQELTKELEEIKKKIID
ncbi:MAG: DNA primase [Candidatus Electryonea clarkiae]|nr:DNA primase [Candidatus Electryonea clarkiae]